MSEQRPQVTTTSGPVRGFWRNGSAAFLGIPFAAAPVDERRFRPPVAPEPWSDLRQADEYGATPQRRTLSEVTLIPEPSVPGSSTLNVNVFTPHPGRAEGGLPVLVYIHGGGFVAGSPASPWYDGRAFNRDGVVTASLSYRLGFEGFGWLEDAPPTRASEDWIAGLEWVRDNIAAFGGNPSRVTIAGQSAGGGAVLTLLGIPRARDLFHRVISLSGVLPDIPLSTAEATARAFIERAGVAPTQGGAGTLDPDRVLELQRAADPAGAGGEDANPLTALSALISGRLLPWGPVIDGSVLPGPAAEAAGRDQRPVWLTTTDNEFNMTTSALEEPLRDADPAALLAQAGVGADAARAYVSAHPQLSPAATIGQFVTDRLFRTPNLALAEERGAAGLPTWLSRFSWPSPRFGGAVHCIDVPFFFDCLDAERVDALAGETPPAELAVAVHGAAVRFIGGEDPGWAPYGPRERTVRVWDLPVHDLPDGYRDAAPQGDVA